MRFCFFKRLRVVFFAGNCSGHSATFKASGTFIVPCGVRRVRVLAVGGGSGGLNGRLGGGGSGYVSSGEIGVTAGQAVPVTVGSGGEGSTYKENNGTQDSKAGGTSSFGAFLSAAGGEGRSGSANYRGAAGGSGGGEGNGYSPGTSGAGGTNGSNGSSGSGHWGVGLGQGAFPSHVLFIRNRLTPGAGGRGVSTTHPYYGGGGGGGGILLNGSGPNAQAGTSSIAGGFGGNGFGAGGGAGGRIEGYREPMFAGGRGADGLVYIEW